MSKFRIHKSFEDELAAKANEFSMKPSPRAWDGIDSGLSARARVTARMKRIAFLGAAVVFTTLFTLYTLNNHVDEPVAEKIASGTIQSGKKAATEDAAPASAENNKTVAEDSRIETSSVNRPIRVNIVSFTFPIPENPPYMLNFRVDAEEPSTPVRSMKPIAPIDLSLALPVLSNKPEHQKKTPPRNLRDGWNLSVSYAPFYAFRELNAKTEFAKPVTSFRDKTDEIIQGINIRGMARYYFLERVSLGVGLAYTRTGENIAIAPQKETKFYNAIAKDNGYTDESELYSMGSAYRHTNYYHQIELPVMLFISKPLTPRLSLTTGIGASLNYTFSKQALVYDYRIDHYADNQDFLRKWNSNFNAQVLLEYRANARMSFAAGPDFRYAVLSTYKDNYSIGQHQYTLGLNFSAQWKLFSY